ncbi:MAG: hypothetical protein HRT98_00315 [Mycoplasmatales bacterium]|nr:hypothetical protein [Mycoplasmatales bacterium]
MKKLNKTWTMLGLGTLVVGVSAGTSVGIWYALNSKNINDTNDKQLQDEINSLEKEKQQLEADAKAKENEIAEKEKRIDELKKKLNQYIPMKKLVATTDKNEWENSMIFEFKPIVNGKHTNDISLWTRTIGNKDGLNTFDKVTGKLVHRPEWDIVGDFTGGFMYQWPDKTTLFAGTKNGLFIETKRKVEKILDGDFRESAMIRFNQKGKGETFAIYKKGGFYTFDPNKPNSISANPIISVGHKVQTALIIPDQALEDRLLLGTDNGLFWVEPDITTGLKKTKISEGSYQFISQVPQWENGKLNGKIDLYMGRKKGLVKTTIPESDKPLELKMINKKIDLTDGFVGYVVPTLDVPGIVYVGTASTGLMELDGESFEEVCIKPDFSPDLSYVKGGFLATSDAGTIVGTKTGIYELKNTDLFGFKPDIIQYNQPSELIYK